MILTKNSRHNTSYVSNIAGVILIMVTFISIVRSSAYSSYKPENSGDESDVNLLPEMDYYLKLAAANVRRGLGCQQQKQQNDQISGTLADSPSVKQDASSFSSYPVLDSNNQKRMGSEFLGKRMGSEFLGKRMGSEFLGKRMGSEFLGKRMGSEFLGRRKRSSDAGKRFV